MKRSLSCIAVAVIILLASNLAFAQGETLSADVVVVGGGGAGLAAAVSAAENGASVILIEKMPFLGGNTTLSTGVIYAGGAKRAIDAGYNYPPSEVAKVLLESAAGTSNEALTRFLASESGLAVNWLEGLGVKFGPVTAPGANNVTIPNGSGLIQALAQAAKDRGVNILLRTQARSLIVENGRVVGVKADQKGTTITIRAKAVVLATGGFAANKEAVAKYKPEYANLIPACAPSSTGDGIWMAQAIGAATVDLDKLMPVPTVDPSSGRLITALMRSAAGSAILVNEKGKRFADETLLYEPLTDLVVKELAKGTKGYVWEVFDQEGVNNVSIASTYVKQGLAIQGNSIEELAAKMGIDPATFAQTVKDYNLDVKNGRKDDLGVQMSALDVAPFYAIKVVPGILSSRGGLKINEKAQVLNTKDQPIPGLYAAGETTGGVFGGGYKGGAFLTQNVVFGRVAGAQAAITALTSK